MTEYKLNIKLAFVILSALFAMLGISASQQGGGSAPEDELVAELRITGNELIRRQEIKERLSLEKGARISREELYLRKDEVNLWGGFGELDIEIREVEEGIAVTVTLEERLILSKIELRGNKALSDGKLVSIIDLEPGMVLDYEGLQRARASLLQRYIEEGYKLASVEARGLFSPEGECILVFDISEGRRPRVKRINFAGNTVFTENRLRWIMDTHVHLRIPFIRHGRFDDGVFFRDMEKIEERYYREGYHDARAAGYWNYTGDFDGYELNVVIYEGPQYRVSSIEVEGNYLFLDNEILKEAGVETGDVFLTDTPEGIERSIMRLYAEQGLVDVNVREENLAVEPVFRTAEGLVDLHIRIRETDPVYVRRIRVEGLTRTDELVVMRHLRFEPGDRVDMKAFRASERALVDTGYFDLSRPDPVDISLDHGTGPFRDVVVRVREGPTGNLMIGGGVSSDAGFMGSVSVTERNFDVKNLPRSWSDFRDRSPFRGGGQQLSLMLNIGSERSDFEISFREPRIRHTDYSFGVRAYSRMGSWEFFDVLRSGGGISLGRRLGEHVYHQIGFGIEHIHISAMDRDAPSEIARDDSTYLKPYLDLSLTRDTRDSTMFPSRGYVAGISAEAGMNDIRVLQLSGNAVHYWPVYEHKNGWRQVFMLRGHCGVMGTYGGQRRVPVFERFYGGGLGSVRGFQFWGISPVEPEREKQVGGRSVLTATAEYTIPVFTEHFRFAFFADAGYVERRARDVFSGWHRLRTSCGAGVRWLIPALGGIPFTLDYAVPLQRQDYDRVRRLHFHIGLGHAF